MLLAIDCGNTNVTFGLFDEAEALVATWRTETQHQRTADDYAVWLKHVMELANYTPDMVSGVVIANVVPRAQTALEWLCQKYLKVFPVVVTHEVVDPGIKIKINRPEEVGADRLVNVIAAYHKYQGPAIIIDFGTATTFDVMDADGNYCGGIIAPGVHLSLKALHEAAAKLGHVEIEKPPQVIGRDTREAMQSGIFWGYASMIEGLISKVSLELPNGGKKSKAPVIIATGGLAPLFNEAVPQISHVEEALTLDGLLQIYKRNA